MVRGGVGGEARGGVVLGVDGERHEVERVAQVPGAVLDLGHALGQLGADGGAGGEDEVGHPDASLEVVARPKGSPRWSVRTNGGSGSLRAGGLRHRVERRRSDDRHEEDEPEREIAQKQRAAD